MHERDEAAADCIADGNCQKRFEHGQGKITGERKVEHVCDAVLESAQDKDHDGEEHGEDFSDLVFDGLVTVGGDEHEHAAKDPEHQKAQGAVAIFNNTKRVCFGLECFAVAGGGHHFCKQECPGKISKPDDGEETPVIGSLVDEVADFAREKVESEIQDGEKSESEKERSQNLIIAREKCCAAESDAKAGIDGFDKINHEAKFN